jgi:prepilin-type N-terminal cleavage/methylation domain-containing protein
MKLRAFTLVEMIVAMIITSVIIYFSYLYLDSSAKFFNLYKTSRSTINNSINVVSLISVQYDQSDSVLVSPDNRTLYFAGSEISYLFSNSLVTRKAGEGMDSFETDGIHFATNEALKTPESSGQNLLKVAFDEKEYPVTFLKEKTVRDILNEDEGLKQIRNGRN